MTKGRRELISLDEKFVLKRLSGLTAALPSFQLYSLLEIFPTLVAASEYPLDVLQGSKGSRVYDTPVYDSKEGGKFMRNC
jgi:hypothetical protein